MTSTPPAQSTSADAGDRKTSSPSSRRWKRWLVAALLVAAGLFHVPLLRAVGGFFSASAAEGPPGPYAAAVIFSGDHRLEVVAQLYSEGQVGEVWLWEAPEGYPVTAGILPPAHETTVAFLTNAGVPAAQIKTIATEVTGVGDVARAVRQRGAEDPAAMVVLVCGAIEGRHIKLVFDEVLEDPLRSHYAIRGLPADEFDVASWWRHRRGWKEVFGQLCQIGWTVLVGTGPHEIAVQVDPDVIEQEIRDQSGGAPCLEP